MPIAYKLFRVNKKNKGKLYPLFVDSNNETPINEWLEAKEGEKTEKGKVKSKIGPLCFRPGWHLSDMPLAIHIGKKDIFGKICMMDEHHVWCECEYLDEINYQEEANNNGVRNGKIIPKYAFLAKVPKNGYYRYKTNPQMLGTWIIAGNIKILRVLSDDEVSEILIKEGYNPMPRSGGKINLKEFGF